MTFRPLNHGPQSAVLSPRRRPRSGAVLVGAMWILVIVAGLVLVMAQSVHTEATAAGNRLAALQASVDRLMGSKPEARFEFIQENAAFVTDLDI